MKDVAFVYLNGLSLFSGFTLNGETNMSVKSKIDGETLVELFDSREFLLNVKIGEKFTSHQSGSPVTRVITSKRWNRSATNPNEYAIEILTD